MALAEFQMALAGNPSISALAFVGRELGVREDIINRQPLSLQGQTYAEAVEFWASHGFGSQSSFNEVPSMAMNGIPVGAFTGRDEAGADLRDFPASFTTDFPGGVPASEFETFTPPGQIPAASAGLAMRLLLALVRRPGAVTSAAWGQLPNWGRVVLSGLGVGVGYELVSQLWEDNDVPIEGIGSIGANGNMPGGLAQAHSPHLVDGHLGAHIIGGWVANGVNFYRLSDGKLAVQNKHGKWKVWKPKRPVVLMPGGASDLRTLLRADAIVTKQAKKIKKMLDRRTLAPKRAPKEHKTMLLDQHGAPITVIRT